MLTNIHIKNFAIVQQVELDLSDGMTALTGETGAGKSILVDALGFALGDRADSSFIRHDKDSAEISVIFRPTEKVYKWLDENDLASDDECIIRRIISREGPSRGYINGSPVPMQVLRELGTQLVDIHGQHEHQSLLHLDTQRSLLDAFGGHHKELQDLNKIYNDWRAATNELEKLAGQDGGHEGHIELLRYQINELETLNLLPDEITKLHQEQNKLSHLNETLAAGREALQGLSENDASVISLIERFSTQLAGLSRYESGFVAISDILNEAAVQCREATTDLRHLLDSMDMDPERLNEVEQRLTLIHDVARKHHVSAEELFAVLDNIRSELEMLENSGQRIKELHEVTRKLQKDYLKCAATLTAKRSKAAKKLSSKVSENMHTLGMPGGEFRVELKPASTDLPSRAGAERVEFVVSANPGQPMKPLGKVASGGELSRISLAIQVVSAANVQVPTMIFDEVDVGIGGGVAEIVGSKLHQLTASAQVICVTHLPQVAAQADHQFTVDKRSTGDETEVQISILDSSQRVKEIARMLGGVKITEQTIAHAEEMIRQGQNGETQKPGKQHSRKAG